MLFDGNRCCEFDGVRAGQHHFDFIYDSDYEREEEVFNFIYKREGDECRQVIFVSRVFRSSSEI